MKGIICACLLAALQTLTVARAYEADIHYSTTYVLARAVGWTQAEARTIASANQALDENQATVAALEVDSLPSRALAGYVASSLRQADKNLSFHCFSSAHGHGGGIAPDVLEVISDRFAEVPAPDSDPRRNARRLIAIGAALHCQQDAHAHVDFGGSCGEFPGSCLGHSYETFLDQVVFRLLGKHYFHPDHPAVSGEHLLEALQGTARQLAAHLPGRNARLIADDDLVVLSDALRGSGLELPDQVRITCNRHIAGKWLFDFLHDHGMTLGPSDALERLAPEVAVTCENPSLASATIVRIPDAGYPRLKPDASPYLVRADGSYQLLHGGNLHVARFVPDQDTRGVRLQLSHWSHLLALPLMTRVAQSPAVSKSR